MEDELLQAVLDAPEDDARVEVYADWLTDRGDLRGTYLRLLLCRFSDGREMRRLRSRLDPTWLETVEQLRRPADSGMVELPGRRLTIDLLEQSQLYAGMLEGLPTRQRNEGILDRLMQRARQRGHGQQPCLLQPTQTPIEWPHERPYPFGDPARLPAVGSIGHFRSRGPDVLHATSLWVVWCQHQLGPPEPQIVAALGRLDWEQHAHVFEI
ncbi:MAG: TIGR02996 domain-containing protein [Myxococcales bacterium]|nr:TIGR02996 domain-containing protein [Myxococcales bacterium]